jgi:hypothetical protein
LGIHELGHTFGLPHCLEKGCYMKDAGGKDHTSQLNGFCKKCTIYLTDYSENEMNRLAKLGGAAWLYIIIDCKSTPNLFRVQNPAKSLNFQLKSKGIQYFLPMNEWKSKII